MVAMVVGRSLFVFGWIVLLGLFTFQASAKNISVFGVRKDLALRPGDAEVRDFYLSGGTADGLRTGGIVVVVRRLPMHDPSTARPYGDLHLPVARLRIIYADKTVSVARLHSPLWGKDKPLVDFKGVMAGDEIRFEEEVGGAGSGDSAANDPGSSEDGTAAPSEKPVAKKPESPLEKDSDKQEEKKDFSSKAPPKDVEPSARAAHVGPMG